MKSLKLAVVAAILFTLIGGALPATPAAAAPDLASASGAAACGATYIVRWGDTLSKIAARCNTTVALLLRANPQIKNPDRIYAGQRLNIVPRGTQSPVFTQVKVYLIALGEGTPGNVGCGDKPVAVTRQVRPTTAPLTAAISELLALPGPYYGQSGLFNPLHQSRLSIQSVTLVSGKATIRLAGTVMIAGVCQAPLVKAVFDRTALQFSTVKSVAVFINGRPLADILSQEG